MQSDDDVHAVGLDSIVCDCLEVCFLLTRI